MIDQGCSSTSLHIASHKREYFGNFKLVVPFCSTMNRLTSPFAPLKSVEPNRKTGSQCCPKMVVFTWDAHRGCHLDLNPLHVHANCWVLLPPNDRLTNAAFLAFLGTSLPQSRGRGPVLAQLTFVMSSFSQAESACQFGQTPLIT